MSERQARRDRFEALVLPSMRPLFNTALRYTRDRQAAQDLVQETYLRAYRGFDGFRGTNPGAWLSTILYSVFVNWYRQRHREEVSLPPEEIEAAARAAPTDATPPAGAPASAEVEAALATLPEPFRAAVVLVDLNDLSYDEAAQALGCQVGTVRSRLFRARKLLFVALQGYARDLGYAARRGQRGDEP